VTARWVVDEVAPARDVSITWQPISLLEKNQPAPDSEYYAPVAWTHKQLRVMEAVRTTDGNEGVFKLYWELGRRIHHDKDREFDIAQALEAVGLDTGHAAAFDDETWDAEIRARMGVGLDLAGTDIGTPIIALDNDEGQKVALFGPVITRVPNTEQSLRMWDAFVDLARTPGFWELKRTRTERPEFGDRP
jgi:hypothetical protein